VALGAWGSTTRENPGVLAGELGRGVVGEPLGVVRDRFGCSLVAERWPAGGHGGGRRGGRWRLDSGKPATWPRQQASVGATGSPSGGRSNTVWRRRQPEG
jgi:hypothetical protein